MTDRLRRCEARDKDGHRCRKHLLHLRLAHGASSVAEPEGDKHRAFGKEWE